MSHLDVAASINFVLYLFKELGLMINYRTSTINPLETRELTGAVINSKSAKPDLPEEISVYPDNQLQYQEKSINATEILFQTVRPHVSLHLRDATIHISPVSISWLVEIGVSIYETSNEHIRLSHTSCPVTAHPCLIKGSAGICQRETRDNVTAEAGRLQAPSRLDRARLPVRIGSAPASPASLLGPAALRAAPRGKREH
ncbi:unnamed protein product [Caretta caretta]